MKIIFISAVALALGACAQMPEPTTTATRVDRIVFSEMAPFGRQCRMGAGVKNPDLSLVEISEKCGCLHNYMVENMDGKLVLWAIDDPRNMETTDGPLWARRLLASHQNLGRDAHLACGLVPPN